MGFTPKLLKLIASYLANRTQYVQLSQYRSDPYATRSGVSQGSVLGPTLFLIMVNDLPDVIRVSQCLMFADDLKLFLGIGCNNDCEELQRDIDNVVAWGERNQLDFNITKCKVATFTRSRFPHEYIYMLASQPIVRVTQIQDLGLTVDTSLTFNSHITTVCSRGFKSLGFVMRQSARFQDRGAIITLYYSFVRSILEFNSIVWDPHERKYSLMLERVQRKFARYLYNKLYGYYPYLYPSLFVSGMVNMDTLEFRRKSTLMLHYYKLLHNSIDNPSALYRIGLYVPDRYARLRSCRLLATSRIRTCTAQFAPTNQAVGLLNSLVAQYPEVDVFYIRLGEFVKQCNKFLCK